MFDWRAVEEKVPTAATLRSRGMNHPDMTCKTCGAADETAAHVFIQCNFAKIIWEKIVTWIRIPLVNTDGSIKELLQELNDLQRSQNLRKAIHAIAIQTMWLLWKAMNEKVFFFQVNKVLYR
ncbi:putative reverse transcriptase zinc-binding domain-containing protein [Helianthus annuus]|nr:putative reverse transcriptase zinc-binding domain-containing protein [Helianthus annuus]